MKTEQKHFEFSAKIQKWRESTETKIKYCETKQNFLREKWKRNDVFQSNNHGNRIFHLREYETSSFYYGYYMSQSGTQ